MDDDRIWHESWINLPLYFTLYFDLREWIHSNEILFKCNYVISLPGFSLSWNLMRISLSLMFCSDRHWVTSKFREIKLKVWLSRPTNWVWRREYVKGKNKVECSLVRLFELVWWRRKPCPLELQSCVWSMAASGTSINTASLTLQFISGSSALVGSGSPL